MFHLDCLHVPSTCLHDPPPATATSSPPPLRPQQWNPSHPTAPLLYLPRPRCSAPPPPHGQLAIAQHQRPTSTAPPRCRRRTFRYPSATQAPILRLRCRTPNPPHICYRPPVDPSGRPFRWNDYPGHDGRTVDDYYELLGSEPLTVSPEDEKKYWGETITGRNY